nr:MAG TPA: hypothetical protein [Caudoviricetes sp.]
MNIFILDKYCNIWYNIFIIYKRLYHINQFLSSRNFSIDK